MAELEGRRKIEGLNLFGNRFGHLRMAMTEPGSPETRVSVKNPSTAVVRKPHTLRAHNNPWVLLKLAVTRVGHPVSIQW